MMNIRIYNLLLILAFPMLSFGQFCDDAQPGAGFPSDPGCEAAVCAIDPFCCSTQWDALCASEAATNPNCTGCLTTAGSDPCSNITTIAGCSQAINVSLSGNGIWNTTDCGWSTPGTEIIFEYTPTTSGVHQIDVTSATGGFIDFFWQNASGGCSNSGWNCIDDISFTGTYGNMSWTSGETYYILLDPETTSAVDFTFELLCPNPAPITASDCDDAVSVCTDASFEISPNGYGNTDELCTGCVANPSTNPSSSNLGCLLSGELNSTWMVINIETSGDLEFEIGDGVGSNCYDWAMWPYDANSCSGIMNNTLPPIRCNWNSGFCNSFTGISDVVPAGGVAGDFEPSLAVNPNEQYLIMFSNWSSAVTSVPLTFTGSASVNCVLLPVELVSFSGINKGVENVLSWSTASEKNNDYFTLQHSTNGEEWSNIENISGAGTTSELQHYETTHRDYKEGINYYRLVQVDFDGTRETHNIISIENTLDGHVVKKVNILGQEVDENYNGIVIHYYSDGTIKKVFQ